MSPSRFWLKRAQRVLASHVDRLQETLVVLAERLRETVAQAVSNSLAGALREAVHALFTDTEPRRAPPRFSPRSPYRPSSPWGEPDRDDREEEESERPRADWSSDQSRGWREVECDSPPPPRTPDSPQLRARWHSALAVGCQTAAWWLRRQATRVSAAAALGIGLLATGAAFIAGIGLAESALNLLSLADALRSGVQGLACLS
jgi:hypothetical protein